MNNELQDRLIRSVYACMRPLARLLLRSGVTFKTFEEVTKAAFVHEAMLESDAKGRLTNTSRVAVRTGLSRKEVRRICEASSEEAGADRKVRMDHFGPPARVLDVWHSDARFVDASGAPKDMPFEGENPCFTDVVRAAGGDVPPGAVRAELLRAAALVELPNGNLRPTKRYFVPGDFDEKAITILSGILFPMIEGVDHNANPNRNSPGFIQRFAFSNLPSERRESFRLWSREQATQFVEKINARLNSDGGSVSAVELDEDISGVGVFYYEGPPAENLPTPHADE
jgi:hypothetical protein